MKRSHHIGIHAVVWIVAFVIVAGFAGISRAECPAYPKVAWWGKFSHASTITLVKREHDGDWEPYIEKWEAQLVKLEDISTRGKAIVVTKDKIKLEGEVLEDYIRKVEERVTVIRCLAEENPNQ